MKLIYILPLALLLIPPALAARAGQNRAGDATDGPRVTLTYAANLLHPAESDIAAARFLGILLAESTPSRPRPAPRPRR